MLDLFGNHHCSKGHELKCEMAKSKECHCACGGRNHGIRVMKQEKNPSSYQKELCHFFLTKKKRVEDCVLGDEVIVLADFSGIPAGTKGVICENYKTGVMVAWKKGNISHEEITEAIIEDRCHASRGFYTDGFAEDELDYLAFGTPRHPTKAK